MKSGKRCADSPLFAEELVRSALRDERAISLPLTVEQSVNDRLATLDAGDVALLEAAAVFGSRIDADALATIFAVSAADVVRALRAARDLDIVVDDEETGMHFGHEFIRAATYARLTAPERRTHHARIAAYLRDRDPLPAAADLHRHVLGAAATVWTPPRSRNAPAMTRWPGSLMRARADFFEAALEDGVIEAVAQARVHEKLGTCHDLLGSPHEAAASFERTAAYAAATRRSPRVKPISRSSWPSRRAGCRIPTVKPNSASAHSSSATMRARLHFAAEVLLSLHCANRVDAARAAEHLARADVLAPATPDGFSVRQHVARAAVANLTNDRKTWRTASFDAARAAESFGDPALLANVWSYIADFARINGDAGLARQGFSDAIAAADRFGLTFTAARTRLAAADMAFAQGRVGEGAPVRS